MSAFLVDTSFLVPLAAPTRPNRAAALAYVRAALRQGVPQYLSAIAASEFQVKQAVADLPLRNGKVLLFNIDPAMRAGLLRQLQRDAGVDRAVVKDDVQLIARAICASITHLLTEDARTLVKHLDRFSTVGDRDVQPVLLRDGFDSAWFINGQRGLPGT